jgi:hypothetical protein
MNMLDSLLKFSSGPFEWSACEASSSTEACLGGCSCPLGSTGSWACEPVVAPSRSAFVRRDFRAFFAGRLRSAMGASSSDEQPAGLPDGFFASWIACESSKKCQNNNLAPLHCGKGAQGGHTGATQGPHAGPHKGHTKGHRATQKRATGGHTRAAQGPEGPNHTAATLLGPHWGHTKGHTEATPPGPHWGHTKAHRATQKRATRGHTRATWPHNGHTKGHTRGTCQGHGSTFVDSKRRGSGNGKVNGTEHLKVPAGSLLKQPSRPGVPLLALPMKPSSPSFAYPSRSYI